MAYPTVSAPYGFDPVNLIGGQPFAGSTRNMPIAYNYATAIYNGDFVTLSGGYVIASPTPPTSTNTVVGVFLGCYYTNPTTKQRLFSQYYPGNVAAGDITAIVVDDPDTIFKVAVTAAAGSTVVASASSLLLGTNMVGNTLTGSVNTGNGAGAVVAASTGAASTAGFRVLRLVPDTQVSYGGTTAGAAATTTSITVVGLPSGTYIPVGTDLFNVINGQLQFTGCTVSTAVASANSTSQAITITTVPTGGIPAGTLALVQTPEVLVKVNFGVHRYNIA